MQGINYSMGSLHDLCFSKKRQLCIEAGSITTLPQQAWSWREKIDSLKHPFNHFKTTLVWLIEYTVCNLVFEEGSVAAEWKTAQG